MNKIACIAFFLILPVCAVAQSMIGLSASSYSKAHFPGGDRMLCRLLDSLLEYPKIAFDSNIQGRIIVRFMVDETGTISEPKIVKSISPECDAEALRVVRAMPQWAPARYFGKPVRSVHFMPVLFKLE